MICYVYMEHENLLRCDVRRACSLARCMEAKLRLEEISGDACLVQHYRRVTADRLREWDVRALIVSGNSTPWEEYDPLALQPLCEILRSTSLPVLGICGGWQLIAMTFGSAACPMRRLEPGEVDPLEEMGPGYYKEWGFAPVRVIREDPLFEDLGSAPVFFEAHYFHVDRLPGGFELLASTEACAVQAVRRSGHLLYGLQFHPEVHDEKHPAGRQLLRNFFVLAGLLTPCADHADGADRAAFPVQPACQAVVGK